MSVNNPDLGPVLAASSATLGAIQQSLAGTGEATQAAYRTLLATVQAMPQMGQSARAQMEFIAADDRLPAEHRARRIKEQEAAASSFIEQAREAAYRYADQFESALKADVAPRPAKDPMTRMLNRQTAQLLAARAGGKAPGLVALLGGDPEVDAELLGSIGAAMLDANEFTLLNNLALERYLADENAGTDRQRAAKKALRLLWKSNLKGQVAIAHQAGRQAVKLEQPPRGSLEAAAAGSVLRKPKPE